MRRSRWLVRSTLVAVIASAGLVSAGVPAQAQPSVRSCAVQGVLGFDPGLLLVDPQSQDYTGVGDLVPCLSAAGVVTGITAEFEVTGSGNASCGIQSLNAFLTITWNNGNTSEVDLQSVAGALGTLAFNGSVQEGELAGMTVEFVMTSTNSPGFLLDCLSPGGANFFSGTGVITFASL